MKRYLIFLFFGFHLSCFASTDFSASDTSAVNHLNKVAASYFKSNPDSTFYYAKQSIALARKVHYPKGLADGLVQTAHVNYFKGKSSDAISNFNEAVLIYKQLKDQRGLSACYVLYGRMYTLLADYKKALSYLNKALSIDRQTGYEYALTDCYKNIGIVYFSEGKLSKALDFYYKALFIAVKNHYTILSAELYNNIGVILQNMEVYPNALEYYKKSIAIFEGTNNLQALGTLNQNIGEILLAQANYDRAITYLDKANRITKKQNDQDGLSSVYTDLGLCYANKNQYKKAISYLDTSLRIGIKYKIVYNQAYAQIGFATVYNMQKDYKKAYPYAVRGQQLAIKLGNLSVRANAAFQLNKTLVGLGRVAEAYQSLNEYIDLKKGLKDNESIQKLTSYNFELSFAVKQRLLEQQQHEKDLLYKQNSRAQRLTNLIFLVIIMAMIVTTGIYYREKRKQQKINAMLENKNTEVLQQKTDLDEQASKLNNLNTLKDRLIAILAHDLRAPLSTLRGLFDLLQDDSISHQELLDMIPGVLKKLEYTSDFLDTLLFWINSQMENFDRAVKSFSISEIVASETQHYYEQASLKGISLIENVPDNLIALADPNSVRIVVRNLITNAIKFSGENDIIEISAKQEDNNVLISIKDTGTGMTPEQSKKLFKSKVDSEIGTHNESGTGMGLLFCKDLVEKCNGKIWVISKQGIGTEFSFTVPASTTS
ncbi:tetratricopeptide repeat-containing sensor histidine kinase [Mucilaginibacter sp. McL0603]|uniref:tetratricopeptide repeat-containing sensor histidine kinase n=1 Tax=Mucilaginibacter sp. McL0603 TaxID=3415670 RepID=UPI003CF1D058